MAEKIDFKKTMESYRARRGTFWVVDVPVLQYLVIDGQGDPNTSTEYVQAVETLYPVAYKLKFLSKRELGRDYVVPPLEGLWWANDMRVFTSARDKSQWFWSMMIMVPEWLDADHVSEVKLQVGDKAPRITDLRLAHLDEGRCVQTLHIGPYDAEGPVLEQMHHEFIPSHGLSLTGKHHEVYLSDPRRTAPERLRTILRQPVTGG